MKKSIFLVIFLPILLFEQNETPVGSIGGRIVDIDSQLPLIGVNIFINGSTIGTASDGKGSFVIESLPVGNYTVTFSYIGYNPVTKTDVIVKSNKITDLRISMNSSSIEMESITVTGGYFSVTENEPVSVVNFSAEEIRRAAGSAGDVSRIMFGLPSLAKVNDQMNSLIVRGGSPIENIFYLDNIEIPNINHFPVQGSSDGPIGILNTDFINDVNFSSGGFSPLYGDRLSSVMNISFREGSRTNFDTQLDLSFAGFRASVETPLNDGKGSLMLSANRSYLDLIVGAVNEAGPLPHYWDAQGKFTYDFSDRHKITIINVFAHDFIDFSYDQALEDQSFLYGKTKIISNTAGMNWRYIWGQNGYSNFSVSHTYLKNINDYDETSTQEWLLINRSIENNLSFRNTNYVKISEKSKIEFGFEAKVGLQDFNIKYAEYVDRVGNIVPEMEFKNNFNSLKTGLFTVYNYQPNEKILISPGIRLDYYDFNNKFSFSPRLTMKYNFNKKTSINGSLGRFYQNIPGLFLAQNSNFTKLNTPYSDHYVLGLSHLLSENTRLTLELYNKEYRNFPIDPTQPQFFIFDQSTEMGMFLNHSDLVDNGKATSRGVELIIQKKLAEKLYGMISGSYSQHRYSDYLGNWHDRVYDYKFMLTMEGGYKLNSEWEFSARWIYAGGEPYTPFNTEASILAGKGVVDVNRVNSERLPDYHSLNLRVDKRFHFSGSSIILYLSVWNVYNRSNIYSYSWNEFENRPKANKQWGMLPVF